MTLPRASIRRKRRANREVRRRARRFIRNWGSSNVKTSEIAPKKQPSVTVVDVGKKGSPGIVGSFRLTGGSGGSGGGGKISHVQGLSMQKAKNLIVQRKSAQRIAEAKIQQQKIQEKIATEKAQERLNRLKKELIRKNAQLKEKIFRDALTGQLFKTENLINNRTKERIFTRTNLETGEVNVKAFGRNGGLVTRKIGEFTEKIPVKSMTEIPQLQTKIPDIDFKIMIANSKKKILNNPKKLNFIQRINLFRAPTDIRKANLKLKYLKNSRDEIFDKLNKLNKKYGNQSLSEKGIKEYQKNLSPIIAEYEVYVSERNEIIKKIPDKDLKATLEFDPTIGKTVLVADIKDKTLSGIIRKAINKSITKTQRGKISGELSLIGLTVSQTVIDSIKSIANSPKVTFDIIRNPKLIIEIPRGIKEDISKTGQLMKISPLAGIAKIGTQYYTYRLGEKFLKFTGKLTSKGIRRINPYFKNFKDGILEIKIPGQTFIRKGKKVYLKARVQKPSLRKPISLIDKIRGRKPGQFKKFQKTKGIILKKQTVKSGAMEYIKQLKKYSGKTVTAVNAASDIRPLIGGRIFRLLKLKKVIRKQLMKGSKSFLDDYKAILSKDPIKGKEIVKLLKKLDSGNELSIKEVAKLNGWFRKKIDPNLSILERSLYLDPEGGLRLSRLKINAEIDATIKDILRGNFKFRGSKPGVLVFDNLQIAKVPKEILKIGEKIKKKGVTYKGFENDWAKVTKWSNKIGAKPVAYPGGSPIYARGIELEVTIPPGEFIRKVKKLASFEYKGKGVPIYLAEIYRPTGKVLKNIKLAELGKLSKIQLTKLEKFLSKKVGKKIKLETPELLKSKKYIKATRRTARRLDNSIPILRLDKFGLRFVKVILKSSRLLSKTRKLKRNITIRKPTPRRPTLRKPTPRRPTPRIPRPRIPTPRIPRPKIPTPRRPTPRIPRPRRPTPRIPRPRIPTPRRPTPRRPFIKPKGFTRKKLKRSQDAYKVILKRGGKRIVLNAKPLILSDAKDFLAYRLDRGLGRSAWFEPVGKVNNVVGLPKEMRGYFRKKASKFRPYKIRVGRKKAIRNGYIEKRNFVGDTRSEIKELQRSRRKIAKKVPLRRRVKKKVVVKRGIKKSPTRTRKIVRKSKPIRKVVNKKTLRTLPKRTKIKRKIKKQTKRKISPSRRKQLLKQLEKARKVRKRNLKKKNR